MKLQLLLATRNKGKLEEMQTILGDLGLTLVSLDDFGDLPEAVEDGQTFAENARKKAAHYYHLTGIPSIADDSGLSVDALGGEPGVHSARWASTDSRRIARVLAALEDLTEKHQRIAFFHCAICLYAGEKGLLETEGKVEGIITQVPKGSSGFGYDPIFLYPPLQKTFAEMSSAEKNQTSHRSRALERFKSLLTEWLREND